MSAGNIHGGLHLQPNKQLSTLHPLRPASVPGQAVLPLNQHAGRAAIAIVSAGEHVLRGQPIAQAQGDISAWLHAPIAGRVLAIEPRPAPHRGGALALSIVIANDESEQRYEVQPIDDFTAVDPARLCEYIARGGIVGLGGATFPTAVKLHKARQRAAIRLLLNGAECEPWISCDDMLLRERAADVIAGARILLHALHSNHCTIAIEDDMPEAAAALQAALHASGDARISIALVADTYPAGGELQLIMALTGEEVPHDALPIDIGIVCQNVGTAAAVARWVRDGEPLISRIVTVTGAAVRAAANLEVRLGTSIATLIEDCGGYQGSVERLIMGGSMMGMALPQDTLPIVKATNCIIAAAAPDLRLRGTEMPCIRCGNCSQVCPARLLPQQLHWHAHSASPDLPALQALGLLDCIECGCCDYVCPSQIPLTQRFRAAKPALLKTLTDDERATRARNHFDARNARLERLENERRSRLEQKRRALKQ